MVQVGWLFRRTHLFFTSAWCRWKAMSPLLKNRQHPISQYQQRLWPFKASVQRRTEPDSTRPLQKDCCGSSLLRMLDHAWSIGNPLAFKVLSHGIPWHITDDADDERKAWAPASRCTWSRGSPRWCAAVPEVLASTHHGVTVRVL